MIKTNLARRRRRDLAPCAHDHLGRQPAHTDPSPWTGPRFCPVDPALPECASSDVGAIVYRDEKCALATFKAHPECSPIQRDLTTEYVILRDPFGGCDWPITIDSVRDCGDHVAIAYSVTEPCATCDAVHPSSVILTIPNDPRPVRATATFVREKC
jgi:hypothetical protein